MSRKEIYVVTHKEYKFPDCEIYKPIVAGSFKHPTDAFPKNYLRDDRLDNVSMEHDLLSEFTVVYWVWKNSNADIVGINHYRRYFIRGGWFNYVTALLMPNLIKKYILNENDINTLLEKGYNCILPKKQWRINKTMEDEFVSANGSKILNCTKEIIEEMYPEFVNSFYNVMKKTENYQKCICIIEKSYFDEYAKWMFSIFDNLKKKGFSGSSREFAFLGERLLNVWVEKTKKSGLKVHENFFVNIEFPLLALVKNHTEFILPKWIKYILKPFTSAGIEFIIGNGKFRIRRRR